MGAHVGEEARGLISQFMDNCLGVQKDGAQIGSQKEGAVNPEKLRETGAACNQTKRKANWSRQSRTPTPLNICSELEDTLKMT